MNRLVWTLALCLLTTLAASASAGTLEKVRSAGVLVMGVEDDSPPFAFRDREKGIIAGYDPDYAGLIAKKLGVNLELRVLGPGERISSVVTGRVDLVAGLVDQPAVGAVIDFSAPYLETGQKLLARKGRISTSSDIVGKKIGVVLGTPSEVCARNTCPAAEIIAFEDYGRVVDALLKGAIDAFSSDQLILADVLSSLPPGEFVIPEILLSSQQYVLGLPQGDAPFQSFLNKTIAELEASGETGAVRAKWFSPSLTRPPAAFGMVVRKAVTGARLLGVVLDGTLFPGASVSVHNLDGTTISRGEVVSVIGDEFYADVDEKVFPQIGEGFLVTMNIEPELVSALVRNKGSLFKAIRESMEREKAATAARDEKEAEEKAKADLERQKVREQYRLQINLERERYRELRRLYDNLYRSPR